MFEDSERIRLHDVYLLAIQHGNSNTEDFIALKATGVGDEFYKLSGKIESLKVQ